jgi:hypothetical protein
VVLHPSYFIDIVSLSYLFHSEKVIFERHDSYVKQTYRNRCYIAGANGRLALNIPIIHEQKTNSLPYQEIRIDHSQPWATNHIKSIKSAYKSSPYFEFYEDSLEVLFDRIPDLLMDWNMLTTDWVLKKMQIDTDLNFTSSYQSDPLAERLVTAKKKPLIELPNHIQVFQEKHGFIYPLSSLDLLFNLGPASRAYLKSTTKHLNG